MKSYISCNPGMHIQSYRFGHIEIDGEVYRDDVKLVGNKVIPGWRRSSGHLVQMHDVKDLLKADAEVCIFGTGAYGSMKVSEAVMSSIKGLGMKVLLARTESACNSYNQLTEEGRRIIAGFHLTC